MNILFCGDDGVCEGIFLSTLSLCKNVSDPLHVYILTASTGHHSAIPKNFADALQTTVREKSPYHTVTLLDISEPFNSCLPLANMGTRFTPLCMLRLFADTVPDIPDKILYLDADVLCRADFKALYDSDISDVEIAGVPDRYGKWFFGNILKHDYLNSGVLLMNMSRIRKSGLFKKCRDLCRDKKMFMPDQSALNKLAVKAKLPPKYNEQGKLRPDTVFKHFTTFFKLFPYIRAVTVKPWHTDNLHRELKIVEFDDILKDYQRRIKMNREIPLFFTIDDGYAPFLAVALNSAVKNADPERRYKAIVLYQELTDANITKLKSLETENFKIELTAMKTNFDALDDRMSNRLRCDYFTLTIYFRLFIPAMFPQYDKGVYIDSDVVLTSDVAELYDLEIGDNLIGACNDLSIADTPPLVAYTEKAVGVKKHEYINSGVLLMNLKKMREVDLEGHFLNLLNTYHVDCIAPDQDYLNAMCNGKIAYLDACWDAMPNNAKPPLARTSLIHYNLFSKPWCYDGVQYEDEFWKYAADSGYIEEIKAYKAAYTEDKKAADRECLELLVRRGTEIPNNDVTFKKLLDAGVKIRL